MKENAVRRDPASKADGQTDHEALRVEREAEAKSDARSADPKARARPDETANNGRVESELAGGNGEQRSRERARVQSEADPQGKSNPFPKRPEEPSTDARRTGAEKAIEAEKSSTLSRGLTAERTSAPMSQSGARITDFE